MSRNSHIDDLAAARKAGIIDEETYHRLEHFLSDRTISKERNPSAPRYDLVHVLWYAGALIVLSAMGMFSTMAFDAWGDAALLATSAVYAIIFLLTGAVLWRRGLQTPGGLFVACAVGMTPLGVFATQSLMGLSPVGSSVAYHDFYVWIKSSWLPMEIATIGAAASALIFFPFPFLTAIIAFSLWFMSMDLTPWLMKTDSFTWDQRAAVSLYFGLSLIAVAWLVDLRKRSNGDFAFWLHLGGLMAFWGGLTAQQAGGEWSRAVYGAINAGLVFMSLALVRRAYAVFGSIGITLYLSHLSAEIFKDSIIFPFALSGIGIALIGFGLMFNRYGSILADSLCEFLPDYLKRLRPFHARESE